MPTRSPLRALAAASFVSFRPALLRRMLCTVVADVADGRIVFQDGTQDACAARYGASTFKLAIALMGYDAGILRNAHAPVWDYQPSYPDWGAGVDLQARHRPDGLRRPAFCRTRMRRSGITSRATRTGAATTGASLSIRHWIKYSVFWYSQR